jgi:hypothetical protein
MTCCQQEVFLWEIETELLIGRFTNSTPIESATLSFDMRRVALIGEDGDCTVWPLPDRMACEIDIEATNSAELTSGRTVNLKGHLSATPVKRMRKLWLEKIQSASSIQKESKE